VGDRKIGPQSSVYGGSSSLKISLGAMISLLLFALVLLPVLQHSPPGVIALVLAWGVAFGALPLCFSIWIQRATPDSPEAGSALFVSIIQVAIAVGSLVGGIVVDHVGIATDFLFGSGLALLGLAALASFGRSGESKPAPEAVACTECNCRV